MRNIQAVRSVDWDITYQRRPLALRLARSSTRLENTSPSAGVLHVPAYDKCYILTTDIYCNAFRTGRHYERRSYPNVKIFMVFQYFDDVCESVNLTTVYSATLSVGEKNLEPIF